MNISPLKALSVSRQHDAVIAVEQNNSSKNIKIEGINLAAEKLLGHPHNEMTGQLLTDILPEHIKESIESFVEYDNNSADLANVLNHMPHFSIIDKKGHIVPVSLKVFYIMANSANSPRFELLIRDHSRIELINRIIKESPVTPSLDIPNTEGSEFIINEIISYTQNHMLEASFATIAIDQIDTLTDPQKEVILPSLRNQLNRYCRQEDTLTYLDNNIFGLFLLDCGANNATIPLERLRSHVESTPLQLEDGTELSVTISTSYIEINPEMLAHIHVQTCLNKIKENTEPNHLFRADE